MSLTLLRQGILADNMNLKASLSLAKLVQIRMLVDQHIKMTLLKAVINSIMKIQKTLQ